MPKSRKSFILGRYYSILVQIQEFSDIHPAYLEP